MVKKAEPKQYKGCSKPWVLERSAPLGWVASSGSQELVMENGDHEDVASRAWIDTQVGPDGKRGKYLFAEVDVPQQSPAVMMLPFDALADLLRASGYVVEKPKHTRKAR